MSKLVKKPVVISEDKKAVDNIPQKRKAKGKTTKQIMSKHIQDENDIITDEDFKNLNIELDISKDTSHEPLEISENHERPKDEDKDPKIVTPWDVIN